MLKEIISFKMSNLPPSVKAIIREDEQNCYIGINPLYDIKEINNIITPIQQKTSA